MAAKITVTVLPAYATTEALTSALAALGVTPNTLTPGFGGQGAEGISYVIGKPRGKKSSFFVRWADLPLVDVTHCGEVRRAPF